MKGLEARGGPGSQKKIWIDLDNSPHVPFFIPIIEELQKRGHQILLTARDSYQVCELVEFHHLACNVIGSHWGKNKALKTVGTLGRAARLGLLAIKEKPDLAISLVSRAQLLACKALGIPTIVMFDYEFVMKMQFLRPDWIFVPEVMPDSGAGVAKRESPTLSRTEGRCVCSEVQTGRDDENTARNQRDRLARDRTPSSH